MARNAISELRQHGPGLLINGALSTAICFTLIVIVFYAVSPAFSRAVRAVDSGLFLELDAPKVPDFVAGENPVVQWRRRPWPPPFGWFHRESITSVVFVEIKRKDRPSKEVCQGRGIFTIEPDPPDVRNLDFQRYVLDPHCNLKPGGHVGRVQYDFTIHGVDHTVWEAFAFQVLPKAG